MWLQHVLPVQLVLSQETVGRAHLRPAPARLRNACRGALGQARRQLDQPTAQPRIAQRRLPQFLFCPRHARHQPKFVKSGTLPQRGWKRCVSCNGLNPPVLRVQGAFDLPRGASPVKPPRYSFSVARCGDAPANDASGRPTAPNLIRRRRLARTSVYPNPRLRGRNTQQPKAFGQQGHQHRKGRDHQCAQEISGVEYKQGDRKFAYARSRSSC